MSETFLKIGPFNICLWNLVFLVVIFVVLQWAKSYTRHGEKIAVPNLIGKSYANVEDENNPNDFEYVITDSTYFPGQPGGMIMEQDPKPASFVKNGRKIYSYQGSVR
jgi:beta-lactam-binding protein with PASTA domain